MLNVRLAFLSIGKGWSRSELAQRIGCSTVAIRSYEQGQRNPPQEILAQLAQEFGVSTDYLLTGEIPPSDSTSTSEPLPITVRVEDLIQYLHSTMK